MTGLKQAGWRDKRKNSGEKQDLETPILGPRIQECYGAQLYKKIIQISMCNQMVTSEIRE